MYGTITSEQATPALRYIVEGFVLDKLGWGAGIEEPVDEGNQITVRFRRTGLTLSFTPAYNQREGYVHVFAILPGGPTPGYYKPDGSSAGVMASDGESGYSSSLEEEYPATKDGFRAAIKAAAQAVAKEVVKEVEKAAFDLNEKLTRV